MTARVADAPSVELGLQAEAVPAHTGQHGTHEVRMEWIKRPKMKQNESISSLKVAFTPSYPETRNSAPKLYFKKGQ